jgi:hypothetical protein
MPIVRIGENTADDFTGLVDTFLDSGQPTTNLSSNADVSISKYDVGQHANGIIKVTGLSNITGPVTVNEVRLYGAIEFLNVSAGHRLDVYRLLRDVNVSETTWNVYSTGNNWATAGGLSNGVDRVATSSGGYAFSGSETTGYLQLTGAGMNADIQAWINGTQPNYGWLIERTDGQDDNEYFAFTSSEGADASRPYLYVDYTVGGGQGTGIPGRRIYVMP